MASPVSDERNTRRTRSTGITTVAIGDRTRDFRRAKRHSVLVSAMRYLLPLTAVGVTGVAVAIVLQTSGWNSDVKKAAPPRIEPENLTMKNPRYNGFNADGGTYVVTARSAQQDFKATHLITLVGIDGVLNDANAVRTDLAAARGLFNNQTSVLELYDSVDIRATSGLKARLQAATVQIKESLISSNAPVEVELTAGTVRANAMKLAHKERQVAFTGDVRTHLNGTAASPSREAQASPAKPANAAPGAFGATDAPIDIQSERLDVNDQTKIALFAGGVRATQNGATLSSPDLTVTYSGQAPGLPAVADPKTAAAAAPAGKVTSIVAGGPVTMTQASGDTASSERAEFDAEAGKALLLGQVVLSQAPDRKATSDRAELNQRADTILLTGSVILTQGQNLVRGQRLYSDRKAGRTLVSSPSADGGNNRIAARFVRGDTAALVSTRPSASAASSANPGPFGATFKTNPNAPVDIESETLEINDGKKSALFKGGVKAHQGDFIVRSAELTAFYSGDAGLGEPARVPGAKGADKPARSSAELQRIEARRSVIVQSNEGQTATGDWADFDTKKNTVVLGGDVVLTQGQNVVRGSRLLIDMATGESVIQTDPKSEWSARARTAGDGTAGVEVPIVSGRPSAIFYPKGLGAKSPKTTGEAGPADGTDKPRPKKKAVDGWGPVTTPNGNSQN